MRRHGELLHALVPVAPGAPQAAAVAGQSLRWDWRREPRLALPGGGALELREDPRGEWLRSALPARLTVAFRRADGTVAGRPGGRRLKHALQAGVPAPWQRSGVPLLYAGRRLLAVGDWWRAPGYAAGGAPRRARRCRLQLHHGGAALI